MTSMITCERSAIWFNVNSYLYKRNTSRRSSIKFKLMKETQCLCIGGVFDVTMNSTLKDT